MDITGRFYYSEKAASLLDMPVNKCLLDNGRIEQYTEWVSKGKRPGSVWNDLVYLGEGIVYSHNGVRQVTEAEVWKWQIRRRIIWGIKYTVFLAISTAVFIGILSAYRYLKGILP